MKKPKLMKARCWAKMYFHDDSLPSYNSLRDWVATGYVQGELVGPGQQVYIYDDQQPGTNAKAKEIALKLAANS